MSGATSNRIAWLTPNNAPTETRCRRVRIPDDESWIAIVSGALLPLIYPYNWEQFGTLTPEEAAERAKEMFLAYLMDESDCRIMIGAVVPYVTENPPYGCLICNGATYNRVDYPALYDALDSAYIVDADTFTVPNMLDRTIIGASDEYPFASTGGAADHTLTTDEMPNHAHDTVDHNHSTVDHAHGVYAVQLGHPSNTLDPEFTLAESIIALTQTAYANVTVNDANVTVNATGGGDPHNNMQPYVALRYCVVAK